MSERKTILVVDDEEPLLNLVTSVLISNGYNVERATNGLAALKKLRTSSIHLVIMDVMMPGMDGFELCQEVRHRSDIPIIMLTARGEQEERVRGLQLGADDYIVKPFGLDELVARIHAVLRRLGHRNERTLIKVGNLVINVESRTVTNDTAHISLSKKEFDLLVFLAEHPAQVFSRDHLHELLWDKDMTEGNLRTVDTHIKTLRIKLKSAKHLIQTVWGVGYKFQKET
ncbi:response regulator transcription factor [Geomicrobium sp. JCM 19039]|uniref:response regulator transcription factor n=1 Tax=Geomicrobium sp. JCM 19039 TaxID=1460636 RepID=UPI00045F36D7|nr:response regulator transcription factor [Geomicrobium sp. JCM 19039]GAK10820.1 DNA-binding response regulator [Geomicrobium sp. JCM 19039]